MTAEFFDQIETEVDRGVDPATAEKTAVFRDKLLGLPTNLGVALAQNIGEAPVGSCPLAVEHPAFSKECDAGTDARDIGAPVVPLLEPRQQRRVLGNQIDGVPARRGNDDDVGFFITLSAQSGVSPKAQTDFTLRPSTEAVRTLNRGFVASPCSQFQTTPAE